MGTLFSNCVFPKRYPKFYSPLVIVLFVSLGTKKKFTNLFPMILQHMELIVGDILVGEAAYFLCCISPFFCGCVFGYLGARACVF